MKSTIKLFVTTTVLIFSMNAHSDHPFPIEDTPILPGPIEEMPDRRRPIRGCQPLADRESAYEVRSMIRGAQRSLNCGNLKFTYYQLLDALDLVAYMRNAKSNATGNCFSNPNCGRPKVSAGWFTKADCETAGGESWEQINPTRKACVNI